MAGRSPSFVLSGNAEDITSYLRSAFNGRKLRLVVAPAPMSAKEAEACIQAFCTPTNRTAKQIATHLSLTVPYVRQRLNKLTGRTIRKVATEASVGPRTVGRPPHLFKAVGPDLQK